MKFSYRELCVLLLMLCSFNSLCSQNTELDSLHRNLSKSIIPGDKLTSLISIANYHKSKNLDSLKFYTKEIKKVSSAENLYKGISEALLLDAYYGIKSNNDSLTLSSLYKATKLAIEKKDPILEGRSYYRKAAYFNEKRKFSKTIEYNLKTESAFNRTDSIFFLKIKNLNHIAFLNIQFENYENAIKYLKLVIELSSKSNNLDMEAYAYSFIGAVYSEMENHDKALKFLYIAHEKFKHSKDQLGKLIAYHNIGIGYFNKKEYDKAKEIFIETAALPYSNINEETNIEGQLYLGRIALNNNNNFKSALKILELAKNESEKKSYKELYIKVLLEMAKVYYSSNQPNKTLFITDKIINFPQENYFQAELREAYLLRSKTYHSLNNDGKELNAFKRYIELKTQIESNNNLYNIESLKYTFEQELANIEIAEQKRVILSLEEKDKIKTKNNILLIIGIIIIIIFSIISFIRYRKISRLNKQTWDAEKKVKELEQEQLELDASARKQQLTDFAMHISEKNDLLEKIKSQIIEANIDSGNPIIKNLLFFINDDINKNKEKSQLYTNIEVNNDSFYNNLTINYPELTEKEKKIATLIRLGYSSKQISIELNVAKVSVNNYRSILRKKLKLTREQNLIEFIKNI